MTQERTELERENRMRDTFTAYRARMSEKQARTAGGNDGDILSIYSTSYHESYNTRNSTVLPKIKKGAIYTPPPTPQEFYHVKNRLSTPAGVTVGKLADPIFPVRPRPQTSLLSMSRWTFKLYGGAMGSSLQHHGGKYADQKDTSTWHDTTSSIRFIGGTLPGIEVPVLSRINSNMKEGTN